MRLTARVNARAHGAHFNAGTEHAHAGLNPRVNTGIDTWLNTGIDAWIRNADADFNARQLIVQR